MKSENHKHEHLYNSYTYIRTGGTGYRVLSATAGELLFIIVHNPNFRLMFRRVRTLTMVCAKEAEINFLVENVRVTPGKYNIMNSSKGPVGIVYGPRPRPCMRTHARYYFYTSS